MPVSLQAVIRSRQLDIYNKYRTSAESLFWQYRPLEVVHEVPLPLLKDLASKI